MFDENGGGAADDPKGGAQNPEKNDDGSGGTGKGDEGKHVSRADHQRALDDMHRFKSEARKSQEKLDALAAEVAAAKAAKDHEAGNFKSLYEQSEAARIEEKKTTETLKRSVITSERARAAFPKLKAAGLRDDAHGLLDKLQTELEEIEVEATSSGRFICHGVDLFVEKVKKDYGFAFGSIKAPRTNSGGGSGGGGGGNGKRSWTPDDIVKLEREGKRKGDMTAYRTAVAEYNEQKQAVK